LREFLTWISFIVTGAQAVSGIRRGKLWLSFFKDGKYGGPDGVAARWSWIIPAMAAVFFFFLALSL